ncbi:MAG: hypothetical protein ACLR2M_09080, partial [Varibaculum sp.]
HDAVTGRIINAKAHVPMLSASTLREELRLPGFRGRVLAFCSLSSFIYRTIATNPRARRINSDSKSANAAG